MAENTYLSRGTLAPAADTPFGIRVAHVDITLANEPAPQAKPRAGRSLVAGLPASEPNPDRPIVVAYVWLKIEDGTGIGYVISNMRLMRNHNGYFLNWPNEVRERRCQCNWRNKISAKFCNWCGVTMTPAPTFDHHDICRPNNRQSNELVLDAVLDAYRERMRELNQPSAEKSIVSNLGD